MKRRDCIKAAAVIPLAGLPPKATMHQQFVLHGGTRCPKCGFVMAQYGPMSDGEMGRAVEATVECCNGHCSEYGVRYYVPSVTLERAR